MQARTSSANCTSNSLSPRVTSNRTGPFFPVHYVHSSFEEWQPALPPPSPSTTASAAASSSDPPSFHLVTCEMTLQWIFDLPAFARKVSQLLTPNGLFVFTVDHPVSTCSWGVHPIAIKDDAGSILYFSLDNYLEQGERTSKYYVEGVTKYHRRVDTYINSFLAAGLVLEKMLEPRASNEFENQYPELKTWRRRPLFLCARFRKPKISMDDF